ncbi:related to Heat shock protein 26 [Saccharomycodes ludwigii]|uniref:Related to Heat shock protein 26 n=1 Tax=Saccharomycodes ludwigii TaxID=36035 RepID=A0A376B127_9ASCO|nr:hypothetical protein SCDLUD_004515 [Saccharomycodes ludwigii]KAH3899091.1 hypothetical protein SCDLUD_004515 [Saccharomycodes ludwigii]SSD58329.1 related to Heat shock protein 26 [Saccharomycodes ludwigii]
MSFNSPFFDFFDSITQEVDNFNRLLDNNGYSNRVRTYPSKNRQLTSTAAANNNQVATSNPSNQVARKNTYDPSFAPLFTDSWLGDGVLFKPEDFQIIPPVDILEHDNNYELHITAPGIKDKKQINIEFNKENNQLTVSGEIPSVVQNQTETKASKNSEKGDAQPQQQVKVNERASGKFKRVISLPEYPGVADDKIKANYENGVLTLTIPKLKPTKNEKGPHIRKVVVTSEDSVEN